MSEILKVENLRKSYKSGFIPKSTEVLKGISFKLESGQITGFLGANGAGKTTSMKCLLGLSFPDSGEISYFGGSPLNRKVKQRIGFLPERPFFYEYLTGMEFLKFYGQLAGNMSNKVLKSRSEDLLKRVDLWHARDRKLGGYSKGMLQKVGMAQALIHEPEFVILDEPMAGLDPDGRSYLSDIILDTASRGTSVFFSSHLLFDAERLCTQLIILREGKLVYQGATDDLLKKMGESCIVVYEQSGTKHKKSIESLDGLQGFLDQLRKDGASIHEIKPDRSLQEAFTKVGLRGVDL